MKDRGEKIINDPIELLKEIEAFICLKGISDNPCVDFDDLKQMRKTIISCLNHNGHEV
mgnify:FL=1|jgi:hypothetical protein